jgi:hypothetical protein
MQYFVIDPSCFGELGEGTIFETKNGSREVTQLDMMLERIPKDDIMAVGGGGYVISEKLAIKLAKTQLTGYELDDVHVYKSDQFYLTAPTWVDRPLPEFKWLKIVGVGLKDDFGIHKTQLVVSESAMEFLKGFSIGQCEIVRSEEFPFDLSWEERKKLLFARDRQELKDLGLENKRGIDFLK